MKGVVQRLQQHFVVAFGGATSVPGLEFRVKTHGVSFAGHTWQ